MLQDSLYLLYITDKIWFWNIHHLNLLKDSSYNRRKNEWRPGRTNCSYKCYFPKDYERKIFLKYLPEKWEQSIHFCPFSARGRVWRYGRLVSQSYDTKLLVVGRVDRGGNRIIINKYIWEKQVWTFNCMNEYNSYSSLNKDSETFKGPATLRVRVEDRGLDMENKLYFHQLHLLNNFCVPGIDSLGSCSGVSSFLHVFWIVASSIKIYHCKFTDENSGVWVSFPNPTKGACGGEWKNQETWIAIFVLSETIKPWTNHCIFLGPDFSYLWGKGTGRYRLAILKTMESLQRVYEFTWNSLCWLCANMLSCSMIKSRQTSFSNELIWSLNIVSPLLLKLHCLKERFNFSVRVEGAFSSLTL